MRGVVLQMVLRAPASSLTHCRAPKEEICPAAFQSNGFAIEIGEELAGRSATEMR